MFIHTWTGGMEVGKRKYLSMGAVSGPRDGRYTDSKISFEWLTRVFDPQTKERVSEKLRLLICDGFGTHETLEILDHCFANNRMFHGKLQYA